MKNQMFKRIKEASDKIGLDYQEARDLHSYLCRCEEPGAAFAAIQVEKAMKLLWDGKVAIQLLGTLASEMLHSEREKNKLWR